MHSKAHTAATALLAAGALLLGGTAGHARGLVEEAYLAGELDLHTALRYQVQAVRDPGSVPAPYREQPQRPVCGTPALVRALAAAGNAPADYTAWLAKTLARPTAAYGALSPGGHFLIHYDLVGSGAVDGQDADGNQRPDYVDVVGQTLEHVWAVEVEQLGFRAPPEDGELGGGPEYDVYLTDLASGRAYGFTYPEARGKTTHSYILLDNNYTDAGVYVQTSGLDALRVTAAHEFNHALQFGYYQGSDGIWWQEATATWMEEVVYPDVDDYLQYLSSFLRSPEKSLDSGSSFASDYRIYGASLFAHFLQQRYAAVAIRQVWEEYGRAGNASLSHLEQVIDRYDSGGLASAVAQFAVWNYFTGPRYRAGYYAEGDKYPTVSLRDVWVDFSQPKVPFEQVSSVDHLGSTYLRLQPRLNPGGVRLQVVPETTGQWRQQLLLAAADSVAVQPVEGGLQYVTGWDRYQEVVLVLTQVASTGTGFGCSTTVTYDPDLVDGLPPVAMRLGPVFPNPFRPRVHDLVQWRYDLDVASQATRLSIFDASGQLVRSLDLGPRPGRSAQVSWDGTNEAGRPVAAGVYSAVLDADGRRRTARLAVLRDEAD